MPEHLECQLRCQLCTAPSLLPGQSGLCYTRTKGHLQKLCLLLKKNKKIKVDTVVCVSPPKLGIQKPGAGRAFVAHITSIIEETPLQTLDFFRPLLCALRP